jgi:hypothetical protein
MDGKLPNMALMRIAAYHKARGDDVEWWAGPLFPYDKVYASKIFKFTDDHLPEYVMRGGTGFAWDSRLPSVMSRANHNEGWFLYPNYKNHLGFSERGCRLSCPFCVVPDKEGKPRFESSIEDLLGNPQGENRLVLLDDDFLGHPDCLDVFAELAERKLQVCFSQGLNIRTITEAQAQALAKVKFWNLKFTKPQITFAWDNPQDRRLIERGFKRCGEAGIKPWRMQFFVLIGYDSTEAEDLERVETLKSWGADPFVMPYEKDNPYQRNFARYVNHRAIFKTTSWAEYKKT